MNDEAVPTEGAGVPRRRRRYSGTHPRKFEDRYKELSPGAFPEIHGHIRGQGRTPAGTHVPVMVKELLEAMKPQSGECVADCTVGYGGHATEFLRRLAPGGHLVALDVDEWELEKTKERLRAPMNELVKASALPKLSFHRSHFAGLGKVMAAEGIIGFEIIYADLGVSSMQVDDPSRGFSYKHDGPLDMRMDDRLVRTAADLMARLTLHELHEALAELGDEPDAMQIAHAIVARRTARPIMRTGQLVDVVFEVKKMTRKKWRDLLISSGSPSAAK